MALINDADSLNQGVEVVFDTSAKTIQLLEAGNLSADGVTIKSIYEFQKEEWKSDSILNRFLPPMAPITDEFFQLVNGWNWADQPTRDLLRRGGFEVLDLSGNTTEHWAGFSILGSESDDQIFYDTGAGATDFVYPGNTSEVVQVVSDPNGDGNYADGFNRSTNITVFNREQGQFYSFGSSSANGEASLLAPKLFSFTLNTGNDLNIIESDSNIAANAPYTGMSITYNATAQTRNIGGTNRDFGIIIDGNNGTAEQIYNFVQYQLRQNTDIDAGAGSVIGQTADSLLNFVGGTGDGSGALETLNATNPNGGGTGVYIDNFQTADTNRLTFRDNTQTTRTFPFVSVVTLNFNANLVNDPDAYYRVYFTDANGNNFGDTDAILVNDNGGTPVSGDVSGQPSIQFDFDYDGNVQGGRTAATDAAITVVASGFANGQYVSATGTISRSTTNTVTLVSATERQYSNT